MRLPGTGVDLQRGNREHLLLLLQASAAARVSSSSRLEPQPQTFLCRRHINGPIVVGLLSFCGDALVEKEAGTLEGALRRERKPTKAISVRAAAPSQITVSLLTYQIIIFIIDLINGRWPLVGAYRRPPLFTQSASTGTHQLMTLAECFHFRQ